MPNDFGSLLPTIPLEILSDNSSLKRSTEKRPKLYILSQNKPAVPQKSAVQSIHLHVDMRDKCCSHAVSKVRRAKLSGSFYPCGFRGQRELSFWRDGKERKKKPYRQKQLEKKRSKRLIREQG